MISKQNMLRDISGIIRRLEVPLAPEEIAGGWSEAKRLNWLAYYQRLLDRVSNEGSAGVQDFTVIRLMDIDGIHSGLILDMAAGIARGLKEVTGWNRHEGDEPRKISWSGVLGN